MCERDEPSAGVSATRLEIAVDQERRLVNIIINGKEETAVVQCAEVALTAAVQY